MTTESTERARRVSPTYASKITLSDGAQMWANVTGDRTVISFGTDDAVFFTFVATIQDIRAMDNVLTPARAVAIRVRDRDF